MCQVLMQCGYSSARSLSWSTGRWVDPSNRLSGRCGWSASWRSSLPNKLSAFNAESSFAWPLVALRTHPFWRTSRWSSRWSSRWTCIWSCWTWNWTSGWTSGWSSYWACRWASWLCILRSSLILNELRRRTACNWCARNRSSALWYSRHWRSLLCRCRHWSHSCRSRHWLSTGRLSAVSRHAWEWRTTPTNVAG